MYYLHLSTYWLFLFIGSLCLSGPHTASGQNFGYASLSDVQGLSQNSAKALLIDRQGYLWIGTEDGLNRFDGEKVQQYTFNHGSKNIGIESLALGKADELYILGNHGVEKRWTQRDSSILAFPLPEGHQFTELMYEPTTDQVYLKDHRYLPFIPVDQATDSKNREPVLTHCIDLQQKLMWSQTGDGRQLVLSDLLGKQLRKVSQQADFPISEIMLILSPNRFIYQFEEKGSEKVGLAELRGNKFHRLASYPISGIRQGIRDTLKQRIYILNSKGDIFFFTEKLEWLKKINAYQQLPKQAPTLYTHDVLLHQDHVWIGVDPFGVLYRSLGSDQFEIRSFQQQPPAIIKNLFTDTQQRLFAFVLEKGIQVWNAKGDLITSQYPLPEALKNPEIFAGFNGLKQLDSANFFLSGRGILGKFNLKNNTFTDYYKSFKEQIPTGIFSPLFLFYEPIHSEAAYISTNDHLYRFDLKTRKAQIELRLPSPITILHREADSLWIGTTTGLYHCKEQQCTQDAVTAGAIIKDIRRDQDGTLLVASSKGLHLFGRDYRLIDAKAGLANSYVYGSLSDDQGHIWVATNRGLSQIDPKTWQIQNYDKGDGLSAMEFNSYGFWKATDGKLYFSGLGGITIVDPSIQQSPLTASPVVLTEWSINDRYPNQLPRRSSPKLSAEQNTLTFYFQELQLAKGPKTTFLYQLQGLDQKWVQTQQTAIRYPQLAPGTYTFLLKTTQQSDQQAQRFTFLIQPPFYQTAWFRSLVLLALGISLFGGWYLYQRRIQQQQQLLAERQAGLEQERRRISRELHDNMGAYTTSLMAKIQSLQQTAPATTKIQLTKMQMDAQKILSGLRDTIWVLSDKQMYLSELVDLVKMFTLRLIDDQSNYQLVVNEHIDHDPLLNANQVVHLKAILQEIIHNIFKHAQGDYITFSISATTSQVYLSLSDNGIGFDPQQITEGNGLENLQWRKQELNCQLDIQSGETGTKYIITFAS